MPLFPSKKKGPQAGPVGGHVTEEEYVDPDLGASEHTSRGQSKMPAFIRANNVTEEEYIDLEQTLDTGTQNGAGVLRGDAVGGAVELQKAKAETRNGVAVARGGKAKGSFWRRALGRSKKEKPLAIGALTEEEYTEPKSGFSGRKERPLAIGAVTEEEYVEPKGAKSDNLKTEKTDKESRAGATAGVLDTRELRSPRNGQDDSVRGEAAYETLVSKAANGSVVAKSGGVGSRSVKTVSWYGPDVDDDLAKHMQDLRLLMLPRRPGFEPEPWDPSKASPFLNFGPIDKVAIRVRIHPGSGDCPPVTFKNDGKRFKDLQHSETSIKLRSQMDYFIGLKVMPPVLIRSNSADLQIFSSLKGEDTGTLHEVGKLALTPTREGYCAHWRSELPVSKDGDRRRMFLKLEIEGLGRVELPILAKIYSDDDRGSSTFGYPLGALLYRCRADPEHSDLGEVYSVDILDCPWEMNDGPNWKRPPGRR